MTAWRKWSTGPTSHLPPSARPASRAESLWQSLDQVALLLTWILHSTGSTSCSAVSVKQRCLNYNLLTDLDSPEGIAIDHLGRTVFWTDSVKDRIEVASLDGSQRRVIVDSDLINPRAIITDPPNGCVLFWKSLSCIATVKICLKMCLVSVLDDHHRLKV